MDILKQIDDVIEFVTVTICVHNKKLKKDMEQIKEDFLLFLKSTKEKEKTIAKKSQSSMNKSSCQNDQQQLLQQQELFQNQIEKLKQQYQEKCQEVISLENKFKGNQEQIIKYEQQIAHENNVNKRFKEKSFDKYDVEIIFKSISDFGDKVEFQRNSNVSKEDHDNFQKQSITLTGFSGCHNAGKSFIVGKILGKTFQQGLLQKTFGFNLLYPEKQSKMCFIDTRGTGEALCLYEDLLQIQDSEEYNEKQKQIEKEKDEKYKNLKATEKFSQGFVTETCNILIHVIGLLNSESLGQINKISAQCQEKKQQLYIIHNLQTLTTIEAVEKHIEVIRQNFNFRKDFESFDQSTGCRYFKEIPHTQGQGDKAIFHIIFGCEGRESGNEYNEKSIKFLKSQLDNNNIPEQQQKRFEVLFKDYVQRNLSRFIEPLHQEQLENSQQLNQQVLDFKSFEIKEQNDKLYLENLSLQKQKFKIKDIHFDLYGDILIPFDYNQVQYKIYENEESYMIWIPQLFCEYTLIEDASNFQIIQVNNKYQLKIKYEYDMDNLKASLEEQKYQYDREVNFGQKNNQVKIPLVVDGFIELCDVEEQRIDCNNIQIEQQDSYLEIIITKQKKTKVTLKKKGKIRKIETDEEQQQQQIKTTKDDL